jgi:hypothetical protein
MKGKGSGSRRPSRIHTMGERGDFLERIDLAPVGLDSLDGWLWQYNHPERARLATEEMARRNGSVATVHSHSGHSKVETEERHRVWLELPNRWRIESDQRIDVSDGHIRWLGQPTRITENAERIPDFQSTCLAPLVTPGRYLFGFMTFSDPVADELGGRLCWRVEAHVSFGNPLRGFSWMSIAFGGVDHTFWVDSATGIVLRHVGSLDGTRVTATEFQDLSFNPSTPRERFTFIAPQHAEVSRPIDGLLATAAARGIDLSAIDTSKVKAVRQAVSKVFAARPRGSPRQPPTAATYRR